MMRMETVLQLCNDDHPSHVLNLTTLHMNRTAIDIMREVAPPQKKTIPYCSWRDQTEMCDGLFQRVITEEGVCYTFNALNSEEIYTDEHVQLKINYNLEKN